MSEEWKKYYDDLKRHEEYMESIKPIPPNVSDYDSIEEIIPVMKKYERDMSEWKRGYYCDAPNKPGYYRANND